LVNRLELTSPGKQAILVCEVLTKTSFLGKRHNNSHYTDLAKELDIFCVKLKPFFGGQNIVIRLTSLDGLVLQDDIQNLQSHLSESLKGKKMGTGLLALSSDLLRVICLSTQIPVAGLFVHTYLALVKKSPNHRGVFDYLNLAFQTLWDYSTPFRRLRGMGIQVKGR
jgi:hypothetical protein